MPDIFDELAPEPDLFDEIASTGERRQKASRLASSQRQQEDNDIKFVESLARRWKSEDTRDSMPAGTGAVANAAEGFARLGNVAAAALEDIGTKKNENVASAVNNPVSVPTPAEKQLAQVDDTSGAITRGVLGAVKATPAVALTPILGPEAAFAFQTYGQTDDVGEAAKSALTARLFTGTGRLLEPVATGVTQKLISTGLIDAGNATGQKAVESLIHQAGFNAAAQLTTLPEYVHMTPEERKQTFIESTVANTAFALPEILNIPRSVVKSKTQRAIEGAIRSQIQTIPVGHFGPSTEEPNATSEIQQQASIPVQPEIRDQGGQTDKAGTGNSVLSPAPEPPEPAPVTAEKPPAVSDPVADYIAGVFSGKIKGTQAAYDFGASVKTQEDIARLRKAYSDGVKAGRDALKGMAGLNGEQQQQVINLASAPQFINEAIEAATGASNVKQSDPAEYRQRMNAGLPAAEFKRPEPPVNGAKPSIAPEKPGERALLEEMEASNELGSKAAKRLADLRSLEIEEPKAIAPIEPPPPEPPPAPVRPAPEPVPVPATKTETEPKFKRTKNFDTDGTYEVEVNGRTYRVFRDASASIHNGPVWYVEGDKSKQPGMPDPIAGYTKADVIKNLRERAPQPEPPPERKLDTEKGVSFGPAYDDSIGDVPDFKKDADAWLDRILKGARVDKDSPKGATRRTLVLMDNETQQPVEVSIWENNGAKITDPATGKGRDALKLLRQFSKKEGVTKRYTVLATLRYDAPEEGVRRPITNDELSKLKEQWGQDVGPVVEAGATAPQREAGAGEGEAAKREPVATTTTEPSHESEFESLLAGMLRDPKTGGMRNLSSRELAEITADILNNEENRDTVREQILQTFAPLLKDERFLKATDAERKAALLKALEGRVNEYYNIKRRETAAGSTGVQEGGAAVDQPVAIGEPAAIDTTARVEAGQPSGNAEPGALDKIDSALTKAIDVLATDPTKLHEGVTGAPIWITREGARAALVVVRTALRAGRALANAIYSGVSELRGLEGFDEEQARDWLTEAVPQIQQRIDDLQNRVETQVLGDKWYVLGRETTLSPADIDGSRDLAKQMLDEAGIPSELRSGDTLGGYKDLWVWRQTNEPRPIVDAKGRALAERLRAEILRSRSGELGPRLGAILNSVVRNFVIPDSAMTRMSSDVRNELFKIAQTERSYRGAMLGELSRFRDDLRNVSMNADVFLNRIYSDAFGGNAVDDLVRGANDATRAAVTPEVAQEIADSAPAVKAVVPNIAELIVNAVRQRFGSMEELEATLTQLIGQQPGITEQQAGDAAGKVMALFRVRAGVLAAKAFADKKQALTIEQLKVLRLKAATWKKIERLVAEGKFDTGAIMKEIAAEKGWKPPTDAEVERMRKWALEEQRLIQLTDAEEQATGGDPRKLALVKIAREEATRPQRELLLRRMEAQWAKMTKPTSFNPLKWFNSTYRKNNAAFVNEWVSSNLLLRLSFLPKQTIDVATQLFVHTPTRAVAAVIEDARSAGLAGKQVNLWPDMYPALSKSYSDAFASFDSALRSARAAFVGRNRIRNVDRLMSGQAALERMSLAADDAWKKYQETGSSKYAAQASALRVLALTRFSYRVAQSLDSFSGTIIERQEMRRQVISRMREAGKSPAEAETQADYVMSMGAAEQLQAIGAAQQVISAEGKTATTNELREAADRILKRWQYEKMRELGLPADDLATQNDYLRDTVGWNQREVHGVGGLVARAVTESGRIAESAGIPLAIGRFGNAIGIGINRALHFTPAGFFPHFFGDEHNAWFKTELDRTQRKVEAAAGTFIGAALFGMAWAGIITVRSRWPKDKEERDVWEREGRRPGTVEFNTGDGSFIPVSITTGPMRLVAPYLAAGGALHDLGAQREKAQQKMNDEAMKLGLQPGNIKPVGIGDLVGVAGDSAYTTLLGGRTAAGLIGSLSDYGQVNVRKIVSGQISPLVFGLPAYQEMSRMAGVTLDSKMASVWDFMVPLPTSGARRVNFLGDPAETPDDLQRITQVLTGGTFPFPVKPSDAATQQAYAAVFNSGYRPPSIDPNKGYAIGGQFRPMTDEELQRYTVLRGQNLKAALAGVGSDADEKTVASIFTAANRDALASIGVELPTAKARSGNTPAQASSASGAQATGARSSAAQSSGLGSAQMSSLGSRLGSGSGGGSRIKIGTGRSRIGLGRARGRKASIRTTRSAVKKIRLKRVT